MLASYFLVCQEAEQEVGLQSTNINGQCLKHPSATSVSLNTAYILLPDSEIELL